MRRKAGKTEGRKFDIQFVFSVDHTLSHRLRKVYTDNSDTAGPDCLSPVGRRAGFARTVFSGEGGSMRLKNVVIVVKDIERSKQFYRNLFGLETVMDGEGNVILTQGLVLQEMLLWQKCLGREAVFYNHCCELYFEEKDIEAFVKKLERMYPGVSYVTPLCKEEAGRRCVRFYDMDGTLIEVGQP